MDNRRPVPPTIQTSDILTSVDLASPTPTTPTNAYPAFRVSALDSAPLPEKPHASKNRIRDESRKLLAHVLNQLKNRVLPPPVYDAFATVRTDAAGSGFAAVAQTVRGAIRFRAGRPEYDPPPSAADEEDEEEDGRVFSTDATLELMTQLRDVLIISAAQGWQIFDESTVPEVRTKSPFRISRNRNSFPPAGRRSRSPSPAHSGAPPELLSQCISILASVISEDCRFQIHSPRPSRPPNSLQALVLDIAQFLLHTHRRDPKIVSEIGLACIPALNSFQPEMHVSLLAFFENGVIRSILDDLERTRGPAALGASTAAPHDAEPTAGAISITVDQVQDESGPEPSGPYGWAPWSSTSSSTLSLRSANAPFQPQSVYYLAALIPPLLAAALESVDVVSQNEARIDVIHRFYRLVDLIVVAKPDAYLDILEVAAYHTPGRRSAMSLISTFWPKAIGHLTVARPLPVTTYVDAVLSRPKTAFAKDHAYAHQFVPWHFYSPHNPISGSLPQTSCTSCSTSIEGFGLMCPFCMCAVHFGCYDYPEGSDVVQYSSDKNIQKVASLRFSFVLSNTRSGEPNVTARNGHCFKPINLFTLCLCFVCREPLWGCTLQGLRCMTCAQFAHFTCMSSPLGLPTCKGDGDTIDARSMTIQWSNLRLSCNNYYGDIFNLSKEHLATRSHEEVSVLSAVLWTQIQIMTNGVSCGSIDILQKGRSAAHAKDYKVDDFELHHVSAWCDALLISGDLRLSMALSDYLEHTKQPRPAHGFMFNWSNLVYIASTIKSPYPIPVASFDLLNVAQHELDESYVHLPQPFELIPVAHLRDILGYELLVHSDAAARLLLNHIHHLGFFSRLDMKQNLFDEDLNKDTVCVFPIPLGLDMSINVEILVAALEGCLADIDLSVNETGFLLLIRKLWPNGMATEYSLKRLMRIVVTWILAEDDNLATILRDYVAKQKTLPGIRPASEQLAWPSATSSRLAPANPLHNGGDYVASRRALQNRYAAKWLSEMHDQDPALYGELMYDICVEIAQEPTVDVDILRMPSQEEQKRRDARISDRLLKFIIRLSQVNGVAFSVFDVWFVKWLEHITTMDLFLEPMPSLYRLFPREADASQRFSATYDPSAPAEGVGASLLDPWRVLDIGSRSKTGFSQSLKWLTAFARSGVDVPVSVFERFSSLAIKFQAPLLESMLLVDALMASSWLKATDRNQLQNVIASLHSQLLPHVLECFTTSANIPTVLNFIRKSLGTCLLLYGSDRNKILNLELIRQQEIESLPSRRKLNVRADVVTDPIIIHPDLMSALEAYVTAGSTVHDVCCLTAKFLSTFLNDSPFLESYEIDNFVLRNGRMLAQCAWQFYDIQRHEISTIRATFLLRVVVVDSQPFQELLHEWFLPGGKWELRLLAVSRLFRIILDVTSPSFNVDGRQWRSSIIEVFYRYFVALWADEKEEIRTVVDTFASGLLPAHLHAISLCWTESLAVTPIEERVKLVAFLTQLRPYFPSWQVLTWDVIIDTLIEEEYVLKNTAAVSAHRSLYGLSSPRDEVGVQSSNTDPDMAILRGSVLLLSLQMIADGIAINSFDLQKIKAALVKALGFADVVVTPSTTGQSINVQFGDAQHIPDVYLPCVTELLSVLDAPHTVCLDASGVDSVSSTYLVGSTLVDVALNLLCTGDLFSLPILTLKSLVESLGVCIYKHDFGRMKHLQPMLRRAVLRALELMLDDVSYEIRQVTLSTTQAFIKRWPFYTGSVVYTSIEQVAKLVALQSHNSQDALVAQAKSFIENTVTTYASNGFVSNLFKRRLDRNVFIVLKEITDAKARLSPAHTESLRDVLLRDTLLRAPESDHTTIQVVLNNIQTFVEIVHHQGYTTDLMAFVGQQLILLTRRVLDVATDGTVIEPAALLLIPAFLIQHNKANSRELLACTDTILRGSLHRLNVDVSSLSRLLHVTNSLYRKTHPEELGTPMSPMISAIFEMLADTLRLKTRTSPATLKTMLEIIGTSLDHTGTAVPAMTHTSSFLALVEPGFYYLQNHMWSDIQSENDFHASLAVGKMILQAAMYNNSDVYGRLSEPSERRPGLAVRSWNVLVLAVLLDDPGNQMNSMFGFLSVFSMIHHTVLRAYTQSTVGLDSATTDINHAYIAIKLWLLLAQRKCLTDKGGNVTALIVWNELWPPFEALIGILEADLQLGMSITIASLTWSTIADLFIFLRCLRSPLALETVSQIATLKRLRSLGGQDSSINKLSRAIKFLSDPQGDPFDMEVLVHQVGKELVATEKVRVLETRRQDTRQ